jgi:hypothetical protein
MKHETVIHPVQLAELQRALSRNSVLIEYVLAEPDSYALAITSTDVAALRLPSRALIEPDAKHYIGEIRAKKEDKKLVEMLFGELLQPVKQYAEKTDLIVVPDGSLHLLPFCCDIQPWLICALNARCGCRSVRYRIQPDAIARRMTRLPLNPTWVLQRGPSLVIREIPSSGLSQDRSAASLSHCRKAKPRSKASRATYRLRAQYCLAQRPARGTLKS